MERYKDNMDGMEKIYYWCANVLTLGALWGLKVIIKKAVIEAMRDSEALYGREVRD